MDGWYFVTMRNLRSFFLRALALVLLTSCSWKKVPTHKYWHSGSERPYVIRNITYYPQIHYHYDKVGVASWYGYDCHGLPTATGRKFDKNKLTAAHRTLPLPCVVIVENLSNGKKVKLLVNDRGPFAETDKRIIDVSEKAAELLQFKKRGCTKVRVTCIPDESRKMALKYHRIPY
jgi:rare lipoprotein A